MRRVAHNAPLMSVNVVARLKPTVDLRRRERIQMQSQIRSSIVGERGRPMKDGETVRSLFPSPSPPSLSLPFSLSPPERRREPVESIVHFIGGRTLYFGSGIIFLVLHPGRRRAFLQTCAGRKNTRARARARSVRRAIRFRFAQGVRRSARNESRNYARAIFPLHNASRVSTNNSRNVLARHDTRTSVSVNATRLKEAS